MIKTIEQHLNDFFVRNLLPSAHIIANTYYELGNKLIKKFKHEKQVMFYTFVIKLCRRKKKTTQKLPNNLSFQLI
jgi:hypothetical protein